jgi:AraC-like DNA-binding protein
MNAARFRNAARYWRSPLLPDADMVTAEYYDHEFTPHWHDAYTVPVIEEGAECYDYRGGHHVAEAGTVPVINPGEVHTGARAVDAGWRYRVFYLPVPFVDELTQEVFGRPMAAPWFPAGAIRDADLARRLVIAHHALERNADPLAAETALVDAVTTLIARHALERPQTAPLAADRTRIETMKSRLADDLLAPVTLAELARTVGLSTFHAARLFTRETGLAPHAWRNQLRIVRALPALREGASVTDVAAASGFTDQSHFTRHFKRAFGVPPGRWR